ncbi:tripartite tricarboxylate transporter TctB family protein [Paenibacillus sp. JMULE4]|uniref:tripartite tricarboxylate transporter TctB family protein n=1 Tax=Paenibacillus TaxID=44249 RepID=UPI0010AFBAD3|nr:MULTISPECIES: tripartite tricarboxylate transporter TctB family protein [Paenibacillus]NTZ16805.1 tripartite tricarboxylate transporter TctB family protein [Paenibacillus sp. JMULE4]GCL70125.1 tripartite tricarboxylate transporter TctB family protein [Paenibacillus naphthalenovorans]
MNKTFDRSAGIVFLAIGAAFALGSRSISSSAYGSNVGPSIFPLILGIILMLLSARLIYEAVKYPAAQDRSLKPKLDYKRFGIILSATILYGLSMEHIGYVISTFLFLLIGFQTMKRDRWISAIIVSALCSGGVYYLFVVVLQGTLPGFPAWLGL